MKVKLSCFSLLLTMLFCGTAFAGWQNDGYYVRDSYYSDDGSRFVIGLRGGVSLAKAKMKNEIGKLDAEYYANEAGQVISYLNYRNDETLKDSYAPVGAGDVGTLPVKKDFSKMVFTAGGSIGFTLPYHPQWRLEADLDHISEINYNQTPLLEGNLITSDGYDLHVFSSGVTSTITTDIVSVMAFYDFFDGNKKQLDTVIPYLGFGVGYASSKTTLKLVDVFGDLSDDRDLRNYGDVAEDGVVSFADPSKNDAPVSSNIALIGSLGASYGISEYTFLDFNFRLMYVPKITWELVNGTSHRDWFSAKDMIYTNFMIGLRFEF